MKCHESEGRERIRKHNNNMIRQNMTTNTRTLTRYANLGNENVQ